MKRIFGLTLGVTMCCLITLSFFVGKNMGRRIAVNFEPKNLNESERHEYEFLPKEMSNYICDLCTEVGLDSDLAVAILMVENPKFDTDAVNRNINGTLDCGLFQLNDRYLWTVFKESYWFENLELDPFNWKHSCYLAIHHIGFLQKKLKVRNEVIMAYNCGMGAVMRNEVPERTKVYLAKVNNNIYLLKQNKAKMINF